MKHDPSSGHDAGVDVDELLPIGALDEALERAGHVCLTVPLTPLAVRIRDLRAA